jgi:hypothetical protein
MWGNCPCIISVSCVFYWEHCKFFFSCWCDKKMPNCCNNQHCYYNEKRKKTELLHTFSFSRKKKNIMYRTISHLAYVIRVNRENITNSFLFHTEKSCRKPKDSCSLTLLLLLLFFFCRYSDEKPRTNIGELENFLALWVY